MFSLPLSVEAVGASNAPWSGAGEERLNGEEFFMPECTFQTEIRLRRALIYYGFKAFLDVIEYTVAR